VLFVINGFIKGEIEKLSGQYLSLICDKSLTCHGLNLNPGHFGGSTTISLFHVENHVCLSRCVQVIGVAWLAMMRIVAEIGDLVRRTRMVKHRLCTRWSGDVVCGLHRARGDEKRGFLG
jgi:hypothetical protein